MRKIIPFLIIIFIISMLGAIPASALSYTRVSTETLKRSDTLVFYTYGVSENARSFVVLKNNNLDTQQTVNFKDSVKKPQEVQIIPAHTYEPLLGVSLAGSGGYGGGGKFVYSNIKGEYEVIRIKLSDYSDYFNSDGSHTVSVKEPYQTHNYTFEEEERLDNYDQFASTLCFESGGAFTSAVPDSKGEVEIHISKTLGVKTYFSTDFQYRIGSSSGGGGGVNHKSINTLTMGDVDANGTIDVKDATEIQKKLAKIISFDKAKTRRAEVNGDGKVNITDTTFLQKYLAKI